MKSKLVDERSPLTPGGIQEDSANDAKHSFVDDELPERPDNSVSVIFSLWSTMMGSTVLVMPALYRAAGLYCAIGATAIIGSLTAYTAVLMTRLGSFYGSIKEITDSLPKPIRIVTLIASQLVLVGACMLFHVYITESFLDFIHKDMTFTKERVITACGIAGVVFIVGLLKSLAPLFKASSYCIVIIMFCLVFILVKSGIQTTEACSAPLAGEFGITWQGVGPVAALMAVMCVSFFCHNFVLTVLKEATRPEKNSRNVYLAFCGTGISYLVPSAVATYAFRHCGDFNGDFIEMFHDPYSDVARAAIIVLVLVVYPIVLYVSRTQLLSEAIGEEYSYGVHVLYNFLYLVITAVPACLNVKLTVVSALVGIFGTYWALLFPTGTYIRHRWVSGERSTRFLALHGAIVVLGAALIVITVLNEAKVIKAADPPPLANMTVSK